MKPGHRRYASTMADAFYELLDAGRYSATAATVGPWNPGLAHGGPPAALLAHAIARAFPRDDARIARIAFDFHGTVPVGETRVTTEIVRPGSRIELSRARLAVAGRTAMEATAWRVVTAPDRAPEVSTGRQVPPLPGPQDQRLFNEVPSFGYGDAVEWRFVEGGFHVLGPATVYARPRIPLVAGEPLSPLSRLLIVVDAGNGISAALPLTRYTFVPIELTVSVWRHPRTDWVGMAAVTTVDPDGIGQTHIELFDEAGFIGTALQTLFVAPQ
jgi:hypothetical protein